MDYNELNDEEKRVIEQKGTERAFSGEYNDFYEEGVFVCKKCNTPLYKSENKFSSGCGWPSFDDNLENVKRIPDSDGSRIEIVCAKCEGHLGHVFEGEHFTPKNTRHCVNSMSLKFLAGDKKNINKSFAYFAAGCFWGVEYYFQKKEGVVKVKSGYMGGHLNNPTYEDICTGNSGHLEVVQVEYDSSKVSYKELLELFFEIHDFTQTNGQGPDIGSQYLSAIFYLNSLEYNTALEIIDALESMSYDVATTLNEMQTFYVAEDYHQDYYIRHQTMHYCHAHKKIF